MWCALSGINHDTGSDRVRSPGQITDWINRAQDVRHSANSHNLCACCQNLIQLVHINLTIFGQRHKSQRCPAFQGKLLPGNKIGMVFHHCDENFISSLDVPSSPAKCNHVQAGGRPWCESHSFGGGGIDEICDQAACCFQFVVDPSSKAVSASIGICEILFFNFALFFDDHNRLLRRRAAVQIDGP